MADDPHDTAIIKMAHQVCSLAHHAKRLHPNDLSGHREIVRLLILSTNVLMQTLDVTWGEQDELTQTLEVSIEEARAEVDAAEKRVLETEAALEETIARGEALLRQMESSGVLPDEYWDAKSQLKRTH